MSAPPIRCEDARKYSERRGLSAAVCADQTEYFACAKVEVRALDGNRMIVALGYVPDRDKGLTNRRRGRDVVGDGFSREHKGTRRTCTWSPQRLAQARADLDRDGTAARREPARWRPNPCCQD